MKEIDRFTKSLLSLKCNTCEDLKCKAKQASKNIIIVRILVGFYCFLNIVSRKDCDKTLQLSTLEEIRSINLTFIALMSG